MLTSANAWRASARACARTHAALSMRLAKALDRRRPEITDFVRMRTTVMSPKASVDQGRKCQSAEPQRRAQRLHQRQPWQTAAALAPSSSLGHVSKHVTERRPRCAAATIGIAAVSSQQDGTHAAKKWEGARQRERPQCARHSMSRDLLLSVQFKLVQHTQKQQRRRRASASVSAALFNRTDWTSENAGESKSDGGAPARALAT
jgi:hypothetical protein